MTSVFRPGDVTYLRIPAPEPERLAPFYGAVFGWRLRGSSFEDASGSMIGHFSAEHAVAGEAGIRPYVYVDDLDATIAAVGSSGGSVLVDPYPEGDLRVAVFRDPAGNAVGIWTRTLPS